MILLLLKKLVADHKNEIAVVVIEPVAGNMGCILPDPGFLEALRSTPKKNRPIFDEVMMLACAWRRAGAAENRC